jgi:DNA-directed RNA polymerase specialized sigma subunit
MAKEYYLYVNGQKVKVSEDIYKVYWREKEHEKYLEQVDRKNHLLFFSSMDHDGHFVNNIVDESVDVEKIVETQMMIEALRRAISRLNDEEKDIIERLYFDDETVRSVAKLKDTTHPALIKRRNKILKKLKKLIEDL